MEEWEQIIPVIQRIHVDKIVGLALFSLRFAYLVIYP
jgi:hypothetical protein